MRTDLSNSVLLYDGVCGLCHRLVQFSIKRDASGRLRFAALQGELAATVLQRHGLSAHDLNTVYFVEDFNRPGERLSTRSDAVISVLRQMGGPWGAVARLLQCMPRWLRDYAYEQIARRRYRIFGRSDRCLLPEKKYQARSLDP